MDIKDEIVLSKLTKAIHLVYEHPKKLFFRQFLLGLFYGLGATIGVAIVIALVGYILELLGDIPLIGDWINRISNNFVR